MKKKTRKTNLPPGMYNFGRDPLSPKTVRKIRQITEREERGQIGGVSPRFREELRKTEKNSRRIEESRQKIVL